MSEMKYKAVPEKTLYIDLPGTNSLRIKAILRGKLDKPVVVMMHGRPGNGNELLQYLGARYLYENGFSSLRLFMYDFEPNTRNLLDCTLQTHADDLDEVIKYLRVLKVPKVFTVGHSYGGMAILRSKAKTDGAVLWDPTHGSYWAENRQEKVAKEYPETMVGDINIGLAGYGYVEPKAMLDDEKTWGDTSNLASHKGYPIKLIAAGKGSMSDLGQKYIDAADQPKQFVAIPEAHHQFEDSDEVVLKLFDETYKWFKEIIDDKLK